MRLRVNFDEIDLSAEGLEGQERKLPGGRRGGRWHRFRGTQVVGHPDSEARDVQEAELTALDSWFQANRAGRWRNTSGKARGEVWGWEREDLAWASSFEAPAGQTSGSGGPGKSGVGNGNVGIGNGEEKVTGALAEPVYVMRDGKGSGNSALSFSSPLLSSPPRWKRFEIEFPNGGSVPLQVAQ